MRFRNYFKLCEDFNDYPLGAVIPQTPFGATQNDASPDPQTKPDASLGIPSVTKTAKIQYINDKTNPILIHLSDGTRLFLSFDAFRRIKGEPRAGKMVTVVMQRRPEDSSGIPSQVQSIHCH